MSRSGSKKSAQRAHFRRRMSERCGIVQSGAASNEIIGQILSGEAVHLYTQSNRVSIKGVRVDSRWLVVVYDRNRKSLVTVLPETSEFYKELDGRENG